MLTWLLDAMDITTLTDPLTSAKQAPAASSWLCSGVRFIPEVNTTILVQAIMQPSLMVSGTTSCRLVVAERVVRGIHLAKALFYSLLPEAGIAMKLLESVNVDSCTQRTM